MAIYTEFEIQNLRSTNMRCRHDIKYYKIMRSALSNRLSEMTNSKTADVIESYNELMLREKNT